MNEDDVVGVGDYKGAAAGWGALKAVADAVRGQMAVVKETRGLLNMNQPHGFDCPGCAWPDPKHTSSFEFCENGAKAVAWEATAKRTTPDFFAAHTVSELWHWPDFDLEKFTNQFSTGSTISQPGFADNIQLAIAVQSQQNLNATNSQVSIEGSAALQVGGTAANPVITGRATLSSGELFYRNVPRDLITRKR